MQRQGPPGYYKGTRLQYLEDHLPAYRALKKGSRQNFWHNLYSGWWQRYPWKLGDQEEPPTDDPEKMVRLASVAPGEAGAKAAVERALTKVQRLSRLLWIEH